MCPKRAGSLRSQADGVWLSGENRKANWFTPGFQIFTALECGRLPSAPSVKVAVLGFWRTDSVLWVRKKKDFGTKPIVLAMSGGLKPTASKR